MAQMKIQLLDLIEKDVLEEIVRDFTKATQVASVLVDPDGQPITREHNFCRLCRDFCRSTPEGRARCYASDRFGGEEGKRTGKPFIYKCLNAGLTDSATPIIVEGYHVATLVMGQVLTKPLSLEAALESARKIGIEDIAGYLQALHDVPVMPYQRLQAVVRLMITIAKTISSLAIQKYLSQKASQKNLHNIINSVLEAIVSTDPDGVVTLVNKAAVTMFGRDAAAIVGQPIFDLFAKPEAFRKYLIGKKFHQSLDAPLVFEALRVDGQVFFVQASFQKKFRSHREPTGFVAVLRDVTQEKRIEKMKEDLIGMLTHDMGNPILSIQRVLELLLDGHLGKLNDKGADLVSLALNSNHKLFGMVSNFLDIFLDECAVLNLNRIAGDMDGSLVESIRQVGFSADDKKITIHFSPGCAGIPLRADWSRIQRTCVNLLENAIRFSPVGGELYVSACEMQEDEQGRYVLVTIDDQGTGIDREKQSMIFEKFFTAGNPNSSERRGVGLGLTFSKMVVEAHGGRIWVESPYERSNGEEVTGCRFQFRIPVTSCEN
ncbi:MAG: PocR ligand-binding domain-containing protein [Desulfuromonadales bacterium]|nr:PocR ligand-binding domain-containing protein [Desulfuromonadales bacterium]